MAAPISESTLRENSGKERPKTKAKRLKRSFCSLDKLTVIAESTFATSNIHVKLKLSSYLGLTSFQTGMLLWTLTGLESEQV